MNEDAKDRLRALWTVFSLAFLFLLGVLIRYQLIGPVEGNVFVSPAFLQRHKAVPVSLARGRILDRHGVPLHHPEWSLSLALCPSEVENWETVMECLRSLLDEETMAKVESLRGGSSPTKIARNITGEDALKLLSMDEPGIWAIPDETRYGRSSIARHVVGYIRPNAYTNPEDNVGESGLEEAYQTYLSGGRPSWVGTVTTGEGDLLPGAGLRIAPAENAPPDLVTTIDARVQLVAEQTLAAHAVQQGAVVILDAATSEILAMASHPSYDQNRPDLYLEDSQAPFVNRAISAFLPGSVWKVLIMSYALEQDPSLIHETFTCNGEVRVGPARISCGHGDGHGQLTLKEALAQSCNSCFIQLGLRFSPKALVDWARWCGFGDCTGIPLPNEAAGTLPNPYAMYDGDIANFCIGQGYVTVTPLQIAAFYRAIAAGGMYKTPTLILGESDRTSENRLFSESTARALSDGLLLGTTEGTGQDAWVSTFGSAGKTGTAESGPGLRSHAWFAGWTPLLKPKYVVAVFVQEDGDGPSRAAPLFRDISTSLTR